MKNYLFKTLTLALLSVFLLTACSKDKKAKPDPDPTDPTEEVTKGTASATVLYTDTDKTLDFEGWAVGGISNGSQGDTVAIIFRGKDTPAQFYFLLAPVNQGELVMGENGFKMLGTYNMDSLNTDMGKTYLLGWDNYDPEDGVEDAATFKITSLSSNHIKGTFTATMVSNSTIKENGQVTSGEIKTIKVTHGKFDVPLIHE